MKHFMMIFFMFAVVANAQSKIPYQDVNQSSRKLTGILSKDLLSSQPESLSHKDSLEILETRSSLKAGFFSLIIPGAGQIYNGGTGNYIKAAGFLAIEAAAIAVDIIYINKGNTKTNFFQNYADGNSTDWNSYNANGYVPYNSQSQIHYYNVYKYAQWVVNNYQQLESINGATGNDPTIKQNINNVLITKTFDPSKAPWLQVNWYALNQVELAMGGYFSHQLPAYGQQQYYELIGKYPQFREGWSDENPAYLTYDQLHSDTNWSGYYMDQRGLANNLYGVAGTAVGVIIANHFLSAIEAAIWAHGHNKAIQTSVGVSPLPQGPGYQTEFRVAVNF